MLDPALARAEPARVRAALARRGVAAEAVDALVDLDARWLSRREAWEALSRRRREISRQVARAREARSGSPESLAGLASAVAREARETRRAMARLEAARRTALEALPNLPATDVPDAAPPEAGPGAGGPAWAKPFPPLTAADLAALLGLASTARPPGPGRGFLVWRGAGARLVRALGNFMVDLHTREHGYEEVRVPVLATRRALWGSAHLPGQEARMYRVAPGPGTGGGPGDLFLAPRAEPNLAALYAGRVLDAAALPVRLVAWGSALRRDGGGRGLDLLRLHEFDTVELYVLAQPGTAEEELERAARSAETVPARLGVPYRRRVRAAPDLSHAAARTIDVDVWSPGAGRWLTVASPASFTDFQARRTATRWSAGRGSPPRLVHTVGGAAVALPRLVAALLELGQEADGSVRLPAALGPYLGGETVLRAARPGSGENA